MAEVKEIKRLHHLERDGTRVEVTDHFAISGIPGIGNARILQKSHADKIVSAWNSYLEMSGLCPPIIHTGTNNGLGA